MFTPFRDGLQSLFGGKARINDLLPALEASCRALPQDYDPPYRLGWVRFKIGRHRPALAAAARELTGRPVEEAHGYDLFLAFDALPNVSVFLQFNARDDEFPAQCTLLFPQSAQTHLNLRSLFTLGTYLTGRLIRSA